MYSYSCEGHTRPVERVIASRGRRSHRVRRGDAVGSGAPSPATSATRPDIMTCRGRGILDRNWSKWLPGLRVVLCGFESVGQVQFPLPGSSTITTSWDLGPRQYLFGDNSALNKFNQRLASRSTFNPLRPLIQKQKAAESNRTIIIVRIVYGASSPATWAGQIIKSRSLMTQLRSLMTQLRSLMTGP